MKMIALKNATQNQMIRDSGTILPKKAPAIIIDMIDGRYKKSVFIGRFNDCEAANDRRKTIITPSKNWAIKTEMHEAKIRKVIRFN